MTDEEGTPELPALIARLILRSRELADEMDLVTNQLAGVSIQLPPNLREKSANLKVATSKLLNCVYEKNTDSEAAQAVQQELDFGDG